MDARIGSVMRYIFGSLGLIGILAWAWWGVGNAPSFAGNLKSTTLLVRERIDLTGGEPMAKGCSDCEQNVCPATAAAWRELFTKYLAAMIPEKKKKGEAW